MHSIRLLLFSISLLCLLMACDSKERAVIPEISTATDQAMGGYDSLAAQAYGADDYGMRKYVIAFLKRGPNRDFSPEKAKELQAAHLKNISAMADAGKLVLAGPFFGNDELRGIYFFKVESIEEAEALTRSDPAIQAGSLVMELKEWYGSAALIAVNQIHSTLAREKF